MHCNFPAVELLSMRRELVKQADASNDPMFVRNVAEFVKATDDLRLAHFELTDCCCWFEAAKVADVMTEAA
jgi:hypothetical protein